MPSVEGSGALAPGLSPAGCLALLFPRLDEILLHSERREQLFAWCQQLPPIPRLALEIRLSEDDNTVDLHQKYILQDDDPAILCEWLKHQSATSFRPGLINLLSQWSANQTDMQDHFSEIYLEWDRPGTGAGEAIPAVFLASDDRHDNPETRNRRRTRLSAIGIALNYPAAAIPDAIWQAAKDNIFLSHVGFMLGRQQAVRVNLKNVRPDQLTALLQQLDWPGDMAAAASYFDQLVNFVDRITIAFDIVDGKLLPNIGLELFTDHAFCSGPGWLRLQDCLIDQNLCSRRECEALSKIENIGHPGDPDQLWPASWIVQSLRGPKQCNPQIRTFVSHLKIILDAKANASAKAYVGSEHKWNLKQDRPDKCTPSQSPSHSWSDAKGALSQEERAERFLVREQLQNGLWSDFNAFNGGSDIWVAAVSAFALANARNRSSTDCLKRALAAFVRNQQTNGGWGYNLHSPADSDSTAWVLKFLKKMNAAEGARVAGHSFLRSHFTADGFATYASATKINFSQSDTNDRNWRGNHYCVAANCAPFAPKLLNDLLVNGQEPEGHWVPFWWHSHDFVTALAAEHLANEGLNASVKRALEWTRKQPVDFASAFDVCNRMRLLMLGSASDRTSAAALRDHLFMLQNDDGSWDGSAIMLVPDPSQVAAARHPLKIVDRKGIFTTASVLLALRQMFDLESSDKGPAS